MVQTETIFDRTMQEVMPRLTEFNDYDLIIGIPFYDEKETLIPLIRSIDKVLQSWIGRRQLIVCVGDHSAPELLETIQNQVLKHPHLAFLLPEEISGRGMSIRAILEICKHLDSDLLLFSANMATEAGPGIGDNWLESLLTPVQGHYDLVVGSLRRHLGSDSIAHMMAAPMLETFYGFRISDPLGGIYAISHDFIEELAHEASFWGEIIKGYGIDFWLLTRALSWNRNICEVNMGGIIINHDLERRNRIFKDIASTIFAAIRRDSAIWLQDRLVIKVADILARSEINHPDIIGYSLEELLEHFRSGCNRYGHIFDTSNVKENLQGIMQLTEDDFYLDDDLWVTIILDLLLEYSFADEQKQEDILGALTAVYNGRVASYLLQMKAFADKISGVDAREKNRLLVRMMESIRHDLTNNFWDMKPHFNQRWLNKKEQVKPPIIPLGYMEYVPGKPIVVPKKITGKDQRIIQTDNIFRNLRKLYDERLTIFLTEGLGLSEDVESVDAVASVMDFMRQLEDTIDILMPGDIHTREGLELFITSLLNLYPEQHMFTINSDLLREMLIRFPPVNLMIPLGYYKPDQLIQNMDPRDAVTYANLVENWSYSDRDLIWLIENLKPESFEFVPIKPIILTDDLQMGVLSPGKISNFNRITARITVKTLETGKGGQYPKLRYLTNFVRRLSVAENYSQLFKDIVSERKNMGPKIRNTLLGVQKSEEFSANNIFENYHHRSLVDKISYLAERLRSEGGKDLARIFELMVNGYGLSQVLEDGTFLTCTAWSWGSYSFKGGLKIPTPLTTSVESRWFNHEFLEMLYRELGYNPEEIKEIVYRLIQSGKGRHNLLDTLLPARPKDVTVVVQETTNEPSKYLKRYKGNPLLEPDEKSKWESKYVLNPGALRIHDKVYLFYRAVGDDNISHIGLAITDGYKVLERLPQPVLSPVTPEEKMGCEDPRLTIINDKIFMLYTAYDGNIAQIAAASIRVDEFLTGNYTGWEREGLAFKNIWDKDAIIFPEKIKDKYVVYHRIEPSIWVTYINDIKFPIKEKHAIIIGPRPGRMWDSLKIGAGAQPLKTRYGWLLIYHGVDYNYVYRLGVILVDLQNPSKVLYRSPNPILEPEEDYEIGLSGAWVPNVVFTCGAVPAAEKEVLEDEDEILVYYGAADTSIGMASATLADLIPESFRIVP